MTEIQKIINCNK